MVSRLRVALDPAMASSASEVRYVLSTILRLAGYAWEFSWAHSPGPCDIYYGTQPDEFPATLSILSSGDLRNDRGREPARFHDADGLGLLSFGDDPVRAGRSGETSFRFENDIVRTAFWLLSGAMDPHYPRDRWDNLQVQGSFLVRHGLLGRPLVSEYVTFLRTHFEAAGMPAHPLPWVARGKSASFAFTHDVDYPEIYRAIESLRLLRERGPRALSSIRGVLSGSNHFWKFDDWIAFERKFGARPAFYFSAVHGTLPGYASGTPDCLYDIGKQRFRDLFRRLRDQGCEIGLHASYNAFTSAKRLRQERERLLELAGSPVVGGRHHYWRLNPDAPEETIANHEAAGMRYDSSLAFELFPGWRRGTCHPFHPYDPATRRELGILEIPPAWMDDHFDRRLAVNGIESPEACALALLHTAKAHHGTVVIDYHVRGMNADFFPRYGRWLAGFAEQHLDSSFDQMTPAALAREYTEYERVLCSASVDRTDPVPAHG